MIVNYSVEQDGKNREMTIGFFVSEILSVSKNCFNKEC